MNRITFSRISFLLIFLLVAIQSCGTTPNNNEKEIVTGSISGRVYFDENADTECDECECGLEEVEIRLYLGSCGKTLIQTVKTNEEGYFIFEDVAPDNYCVYSDLSITCDGYLPTTSISRETELNPGENIELEWFGYDLYIDIED